jgi:hypothetical protein
MEVMDCAPSGGVRVASLPGPELGPRLRAATAGAHRRLETRLALIDPLAPQAHFVAVLKGFLGFHRAWERAVAQADRASAPPIAAKVVKRYFALMAQAPSTKGPALNTRNTDLVLFRRRQIGGEFKASCASCCRAAA